MLGSSKNKASPKCFQTLEHKFDSPGLQLYFFYVLTHQLENDSTRRMGNAFSAPGPRDRQKNFKWGSTGLIQGNGDICQTCLKNKTLLSNARLTTEKALAGSLTMPCSWNHTEHYVRVEMLSVLQPLYSHRVKNINFSKQHSWMWWSRAAPAHRQKNPSWF